MSERKQTPDILADLLGGVPALAAAEESLPAPHQAAPARSAKTVEKPASNPPMVRKQPEKRAAIEKPASLRWEHRIASFQEHKGWRLRFVDGVEVQNWANGLTLCAYIAQVSTEGWQVAGACAGQAMFGLLDKYQIFLKRSV